MSPERTLAPEPVPRACKLARLVLVDGTPRLAPLHDRPAGTGWYAPRAVARCEAGHDHPAPHPTCGCGFWAVRSTAALDRLGGWTSERVALEVRLGGTVVEAEHGFRAQQQAVDRVLVPDRCTRCDRPTTHLGRDRLRRSLLKARCARHAGRGAYPLADLAEALTVPVSTAERTGGASAAQLRRARALGAVPPLLAAVLLAVLALVADAAPVASVGVAALAVWPLVARWRRADRGEEAAAWSAATAAATLAGWTLLGLVAAGLAPPV